MIDFSHFTDSELHSKAMLGYDNDAHKLRCLLGIHRPNHNVQILGKMKHQGLRGIYERNSFSGAFSTTDLVYITSRRMFPHLYPPIPKLRKEPVHTVKFLQSITITDKELKKRYSDLDFSEPLGSSIMRRWQAIAQGFKCARGLAEMEYSGQMVLHSYPITDEQIKAVMNRPRTDHERMIGYECVYSKLPEYLNEWCDAAMGMRVARAFEYSATTSVRLRNLRSRYPLPLKHLNYNDDATVFSV